MNNLDVLIEVANRVGGAQGRGVHGGENRSSETYKRSSERARTAFPTSKKIKLDEQVQQTLDIISPETIRRHDEMYVMHGCEVHHQVRQQLLFQQQQQQYNSLYSSPFHNLNMLTCKQDVGQRHSEDSVSESSSQTSLPSSSSLPSTDDEDSQVRVLPYKSWEDEGDARGGLPAKSYRSARKASSSRGASSRDASRSYVLQEHQSKTSRTKGHSNGHVATPNKAIALGLLGQSKLLANRRREMIEIIVSAFNCSDVLLLHGLLSEATIDNVQLTSSTLGCELFGLNPLMVYFGLLLECYPDGMMTPRSIHSVVDVSADSLEFHFRFIGTRVTSKSFTTIFSTLADCMALGVNVCTRDILEMITKYRLNSHTQVPHALVPEMEPRFVNLDGKIVFTFDGNHKIFRWFFDLMS